MHTHVMSRVKVYCNASCGGGSDTIHILVKWAVEAAKVVVLDEMDGDGKEKSHQDIFPLYLS